MNSIKNIVLIEDDRISALITERILKMLSNIENIFVFPNGKVAYENLKNWDQTTKPLPDIIFLDLFMPIWDGWQFLEEFRKLEIYHQIPVYILSSSTSHEDKEKARDFSLDKKYLNKPLRKEDATRVFESISSS